MDDGQIKIRDQHAEEGEYWCSRARMSIQTEYTNKSISNSSDADEADIVARAPKRDKPTSDASNAAPNTAPKRVKPTSDGFDAEPDIASDLPADSFLMTFIESEKFNAFLEEVLNAPHDYKIIRDKLDEKEDNVKNLLSRSPDPLLKEIISTITSSRRRLSRAALEKIVEDSPEYKIFIDQMEKDPNNIEDHIERLEKNDPFLKELFSQDLMCFQMLRAMDHKIDRVKYLINVGIKSNPSLFGNLGEAGARSIIAYIQEKVTCEAPDALVYLFNTGNKDEAVASLRKRNATWSRDLVL